VIAVIVRANKNIVQIKKKDLAEDSVTVSVIFLRILDKKKFKTQDCS